MLQDISESGAAVGITGAGAAALFTNEAFVELQVEGHEAYGGRVVRQFAGGYALEFDHTEAERKHMREEIKKFEAVVSRGGSLEA
ncbi:MAG: hypothetical protein HOA30_09910 [Rhodospirillaceae bacterium]|nr:hypothetical protein [Rhodospirillaceae bacterium]MBT5297297.1 hypothetical protein [Rhodospirillaceae bacterium]MBT5513568.1 hypothetical protein [Rhodospirillaceae bacterium]MBT6087788.1 hypothetical protein [Rhodospirillaceae bacterium]MBT6884348.1 hypothetical protein [Rhodospirillaceae bacterium]